MSKSKPQAPPNADDPGQSRRFIDMSREVEADETPGALDRVLDKLIRSPDSKKSHEPGES